MGVLEGSSLIDQGDELGVVETVATVSLVLSGAACARGGRGVPDRTIFGAESRKIPW